MHRSGMDGEDMKIDSVFLCQRMRRQFFMENLMIKLFLLRLSAISLMVFSLLSGMAHATTAQYPTKPITLIVGFPPGGGADVLARTIAPELEAALKTNIIIENKPGASGIIATTQVSRAKPDGYTLYIATPGSLTILPNLQDVSYDPAAFSAISVLVKMPNILVTANNSDIRSVADLISKAKSKDITYASGGNGTIGQMAGEQFNLLAKVSMRHVPYRGTTPALTDVIGKVVDVTFSDPSTKSLLDGGKLRALAVTGPQRSTHFPNVPTLAEAGLPGYELVNWYGIVGPPGMPEEIVKHLNAALLKVMANPEIARKLVAQGGMDAFTSTPAAFSELIKSERLRWADLIKKANISLK